MAAKAYKYVSNKDPWSGTTRLVIERNEDGSVKKAIYLGGDAVRLTKEQVERFNGRVNLEEVDSGEATTGKVDEDSSEAANNAQATGPRVDARSATSQPDGSTAKSSDNN